MTVYKPIEAIAYAAASAAARVGNNENNSEANQYLNNGKKRVPLIQLTAMVVNKDNINMTVVAAGYLKEHNLIPLIPDKVLYIFRKINPFLVRGWLWQGP